MFSIINSANTTHKTKIVTEWLIVHFHIWGVKMVKSHSVRTSGFVSRWMSMSTWYFFLSFFFSLLPSGNLVCPVPTSFNLWFHLQSQYSICLHCYPYTQQRCTCALQCSNQVQGTYIHISLPLATIPSHMNSIQTVISEAILPSMQTLPSDIFP